MNTNATNKKEDNDNMAKDKWRKWAWKGGQRSRYSESVRNQESNQWRKFLKFLGRAGLYFNEQGKLMKMDKGGLVFNEEEELVKKDGSKLKYMTKTELELAIHLIKEIEQAAKKEDMEPADEAVERVRGCEHFDKFLYQRWAKIDDIGIENFYEVFGLSQDASKADLQIAYK